MVKFSLGEAVFSEKIVDKIIADSKFENFVCLSIKKFTNGDWGEVTEKIKVDNDNSVAGESEIYGLYEDEHGVEILFITVKQRDKTLISLMDEIHGY